MNYTPEDYRKWIENYDRPSGPQTLISPEGWRDALRWALDRIEELEREISECESWKSSVRAYVEMMQS